ncbi:hypothetical protein [Dactylosporangium darangshiense]|uniref:Phosphodiesterase n=1 Tax=Dactylosporangium darangshiense TaxID=579108 RepID=A0ABP8DUT6_9ACTN
MPRLRLRFDGWIAGLGTASGTRLVVGNWPVSPFGPVTDVMLERADGHRLLLAATSDLAAFVVRTYTFDEVLVVPVSASQSGRRWTVVAGPLLMRFTVGRRTPLGLLLRAVPPVLASRPWWVRLIDGPARLAQPGVRTYGSAGNGHREWYGARDLRRITDATATLDGTDLGALTAVDPPVRFGFGSTPRAPSLLRITTIVELPQAGPGRHLPA